MRLSPQAIRSVSTPKTYQYAAWYFRWSISLPTYDNNISEIIKIYWEPYRLQDRIIQENWQNRNVCSFVRYFDGHMETDKRYANIHVHETYSTKGVVNCFKSLPLCKFPNVACSFHPRKGIQRKKFRLGQTRIWRPTRCGNVTEEL